MFLPPPIQNSSDGIFYCLLNRFRYFLKYEYFSLKDLGIVDSLFTQFAELQLEVFDY